MSLALRAGRLDWRAWLRTLTSRELTEWMAYFDLQVENQQPVAAAPQPRARPAPPVSKSQQQVGLKAGFAALEKVGRARRI